MSLSINTNISSLQAQQTLNNNSSGLANTLERLATGKRINSAADDAAGYAITQSQLATINTLDQGMKNGNDGISMMQVANSGIGSILDGVQQMVSLAGQSITGTVSASQRSDLQGSFSAIQTQINSIVNTTQFNGLNLLDGSLGSIAIALGNGNDIVADFGTNLGTALLSLGDDILTAGMTASAASAYAGAASSQQITTANSGWNAASTAVSGVSGAAAAGAGTSASAAVVTNAAATAVALNLAAAAYFSAAAASDGFTAAAASAFTSAAAAYTNAAAAESAFAAAVGTGGTASATTIAAYSTASAANASAVTAALAAVSSAYTQAAGGATGAAAALADIQADLVTLTTLAATLGATQVNLEGAVQNNLDQSIATQAARSTVLDTDYAAETADLSKFQVLVQAGVSVLQQANQAPQVILKLLG